MDRIRLSNLKNILPVLVKGFSACGIDYFLIGALARDMHMTGVYEYDPQRATQDIDFAVLTNSAEDYKELLAYFIDAGSFTETSEPYRLKYEDGRLVDLLPFGQIESQERTVRIGGREVVELFAIGLQENLEFAETFIMEDGFELKVTTLYGICILKFIAWNDKPLEREKDIKDILYILGKYAEIYQDEIFEHHSDLLEDGWPDWLGARILGRHMCKVLKSNGDLKEKLTAILLDNVTVDSPLPILFTELKRDNIESNIELINHILKGINESL